MIKKAIIPAAGFGTRGLPMTKVLPKEMLPIGGRPAIDYIVEEAVNAGIEQILMIVSRTKNLIVDYYDRSLELEAFLEQQNKEHLLDALKLPKVKIYYTRQLYPKGLGDAVSLAKEFVGNDPFAILLPDEIYLSNKENPLEELIDFYKNYEKNVIALQKVADKHLNSYGIVKVEKREKGRLYKIYDIVEKPQNNPPSNLAVTGRYILKPNIFSCLEKIKPGVGSEVQLTDAIKLMLQSEPAYGLEIASERFDIAKEAEYIKLVQKIYTLKHGEQGE
ncbi:UTP--glucose-1-phosphate uridylyltransferase [Bacillus timonensis]|uniref:UTP--glucose-1-phosphate uridylyltransferase n=1 Tax=Bacillus timonensis TaxID=1033734 RepID=A0A4S3PT64_9BACI|nr:MULTISPECIES: UTP--glucose-1-phosphate uridylyltransferase [Bacillus]MCC3355653.1 UTP--glucose-1-phosphate uridylyltransferase [Bacillus sp. REN16]THE12032.1 UTP--glucose-1-phosphate uridylyltransferase [Bacillus timonensis]